MGYREAMAAAGRLERRRNGQRAEATQREQDPAVVEFQGRYYRVGDALVVLGRLGESLAAEVIAAGFVLRTEEGGQQLWVRYR